MNEIQSHQSRYRGILPLRIILGTFMVFTLSVSGALRASEVKMKPSSTQTVDASKSVVHWTGRKKILNDQHHGTLRVQSGSITWQGPVPKRGEVILDMKSIVNKDLPEGKRGKLEGHLKSSDFFDVEHYPTAKFEVTNAMMDRGGATKVFGNLTLKGKTHPIEFPARVKKTKDGYHASAKFQIDRTLWDVRYGSKTFVDDLLDKQVIDNSIDLEIEIVSRES